MKKIRTNLRTYFLHCHMRDKIVILEEGNRPHPHCPNCDMFVPRTCLNLCHYTTAICMRGADQKHRRLVQEEEIDKDEISYKNIDRPS